MNHLYACSLLWVTWKNQSDPDKIDDLLSKATELADPDLTVGGSDDDTDMILVEPSYQFTMQVSAPTARRPKLDGKESNVFAATATYIWLDSAEVLGCQSYKDKTNYIMLRSNTHGARVIQTVYMFRLSVNFVTLAIYHA